MELWVDSLDSFKLQYYCENQNGFPENLTEKDPCVREDEVRFADCCFV